MAGRCWRAGSLVLLSLCTRTVALPPQSGSAALDAGSSDTEVRGAQDSGAPRQLRFVAALDTLIPQENHSRTSGTAADAHSAWLESPQVTHALPSVTPIDNATDSLKFDDGIEKTIPYLPMLPFGIGYSATEPVLDAEIVYVEPMSVVPLVLVGCMLLFMSVTDLIQIGPSLFAGDSLETAGPAADGSTGGKLPASMGEKKRVSFGSNHKERGRAAARNRGKQASTTAEAAAATVAPMPPPAEDRAESASLRDKLPLFGTLGVCHALARQLGFESRGVGLEAVGTHVTRQARIAHGSPITAFSLPSPFYLSRWRPTWDLKRSPALRWRRPPWAPSSVSWWAPSSSAASRHSRWCASRCLSWAWSTPSSALRPNLATVGPFSRS